MTILTFGTSNKDKLSEVRAILWPQIVWYTPDDLQRIQEVHGWEIPEIQSMDVRDIVKHKAKMTYDTLGRPIVVEDTWLHINALRWFPWPFVKHVLKWPGLEAIFKMMSGIQDRSARAITGVCMYDGKDYTTGYWVLEGRISKEPRWDKFGFSNAFEVEGDGRTFWEMTEDEKNRISMRKIAFEDFMQNYLASQGK